MSKKQYIYKEEFLSEKEIAEIAELKGYTLQELLEKNPEIKLSDDKTEVTEEIITDPTKEGKENSTTEEDATVAEETVAPDTALVSENGSLEPQEIDNSPEAIKARREFNRQEEIAIMQDPIELEEVELTAKKPKPFSYWKEEVLSEKYEDAFKQLSKDTGEFSSTNSGGIKNLINYFSQITKLVTPEASKEEDPTYDPINIDLLTRIEVAKILTPRSLDKLKKGGFNLKEKELFKL